MKSVTAKIISVGTELLLGDTVDTNSTYISSGLSEIGINLFYRETVGDNHDRLVGVLKEAFNTSDIVITSGGLGATCDDITKEAVAEALGLKLQLHEHSLERIKSFFSRRGSEMTDNNIKQAYIPEGATVFDNDYGTAPVLAVEKDGKTAILLPGPPRELCPMFDNFIKPWLKEKFSDSIIVSRTLRVYGIGESTVEDRLRTLMDTSLNPTLAPYAKTGETVLRLTARGKTTEECNALIDNLEEKVRDIIGEYIYGVDISGLEEALLTELNKRNLTVSFAESCTGGLASKRLVDISGASKVMSMSVVTYSKDAKMKLLKVKKETLDTYGAVSAECAIEMAEGIFNISDSDIAVSVTGVAGPESDEGKEVGTVYLGVKSKLGSRTVPLNLKRGKKEREYIRQLAVNAMFSEAIKEAEKLS